jgi:prepilin-type N-terminal cleavage/methylation domain-containing protein
MIKKFSSKPLKRRLGFSLAEVLIALMIGSMVLVMVLTVYSRAEASAAAVTRKLYGSQLPREVLQRIAEDVDKVITAGSDTKLIVENKFQNGFPTARLTIQKTIYDSKNRKQIFENIIWQSSYDTDANGVVLYRSHSGIALEDKLLDEQKEAWERALFVPVCPGVTFFQIQIPQGERFRNVWKSDSLPKAIVATISFAKPFKTLEGTWDVPDEEKITRTIAIDRTRTMRLVFPKKQIAQESDIIDSNEVNSEEEDLLEDSNEMDYDKEDLLSSNEIDIKQENNK